LDSPSKRTRLSNNGWDDANNDLIIRLGEIWNDRYRINRLLGKGSFGQVVEAYDMTKRELVAIKVIKNRKAFSHQALVEIRILEFLNHHDGDDLKNIGTRLVIFAWNADGTNRLGNSATEALL
jgi:serine/threonine protein kinase